MRKFGARNRDNARRRKLRDELYAALPEGEKPTDEQRDATRENYDAMTLRLRLECADLDCDAAQALEKTTLRAGSGIVLYERHAFDSRLPEAERFPFTPTPKQMLYGMRGTIVRFERDGDAGVASFGNRAAAAGQQKRRLRLSGAPPAALRRPRFTRSTPTPTIGTARNARRQLKN